MAHFFGFVRVVFMIGLYATCFAGGNPEDALLRPYPSASEVDTREAKPSQFTGRADWVYKASDWVLNLYITNKGTRSQGSHGVLFFEGKKIDGTPGETRALPIGTVEYNGSEQVRAHLWDNSGWQMKDPLVQPVINTPPGHRLPTRPAPDIKALEKDLESSLSN